MCIRDRNEAITAKEFAGAALVQREIKRGVTAAIDEESCVFEVCATFCGNRSGRSLITPMLPREQIAPGMVAKYVIVCIAGAQLTRESRGKAIIERARLREP